MSGGFQWLAVVAALLAIVIVAEAWLGHYRSGFPLRVPAATRGGCVGRGRTAV
jgi:hypothetical protein